MRWKKNPRPKIEIATYIYVSMKERFQFWEQLQFLLRNSEMNLTVENMNNNPKKVNKKVDNLEFNNRPGLITSKP